MRIARLPISELKPAPYNPRVALRPGMPGYERLKRSLEEFDLVQPIVWNRTTGHVVGGHQRLQVLTDQGRTEIDCVVIEASLEREKALNVALNNPQVGGKWDEDKLLDLVAELESLPDIDATLTGFSAADLQHLHFQPLPASELPQAEPSGPPVVQVTLELPPDDWAAAHPVLDEFLAQFPRTRLHVRHPS